MPRDDVDQVMLWPSEKNYARFVAVSEGSVLTDYREFLAAAQELLEQARAAGLNVAKVDPDPDQMAAWCRANFGHVKSNARAAYAAHVVFGEGSEDDTSH